MAYSQQKLPKVSARDFLAGVIVFFIALPLCLGIAQASGAPAFSGIISGVIGGIVIGALSRSHLSVSGPAAGLIAIVVAAISTLGSFELFLCAVMVAGLVQLLLGVIRAGGIADYIPSNVIEGMLAGIGLTIIIKESVNAVGVDKAAFIAEGDPGFQWSDVAYAFQHVQPGALTISLIGLAVFFLWTVKPFKKLQFLLPAAVLVVLLGVVLNEIFLATGSAMALGDSHLVSLPVPSSISDFFSQFKSPDFSGFSNPQVWITGLVIAAVASIETLLCIEAVGKLDPLKRYTSGNAELRAQGVGNTIAGLIGGLPITSVIVRSSANVNAGARTKVSAIVHGTLLLVCVGTIPTLLNHIPKAALAAILIFTGYRLARPAVWRHMWKGGMNQFIPFVATALCVVSLDLLKGVGIGLVISILFLLRQNARVTYFYQRSTFANGELIKLSLAQEVSFLNKAAIKHTLEKLPPDSAVIIDASNTEYIDYDVLEAIRDFHQSQAPEKNIKLSLIGFKDEYKLPHLASEREVVRTVTNGDDGVPAQSAGTAKQLLKQLQETPEEDQTNLPTDGDNPAARAQA